VKAFADLLDRLSYSPSRNAKLRLMADYFRSTPDPDRGWALAALTDGLPFSFPLRRTLSEMMDRRMDPVLFRLSRDYVGDTAETIALAWPAANASASPSPSPDVFPEEDRLPSSSPPPSRGRDRVGGTPQELPLELPPSPNPSPQGGNGQVGARGKGATTATVGEADLRLGDIVGELSLIGRNELGPRLESWLDRLDTTSRWALLKLLTGALRVGVSARLAKTALAEAAGMPVSDIEEVWHGLAPPYAPLFAWIEGRAGRPSLTDAPVFRPLMLSHALEEADWQALDLDQFSAEWKWDGIRVQVASRDGETHLFSRTGDDIGHSFLDVIGTWSFEAVLDGELLVVRDGKVAPFNDLQQRLNRKGVSKKQMEQFPGHVRLYDALLIEGEDLRQLTFMERRARLEAWFARVRPRRADLSERIDITNKAELERAWTGTRATGIEGLMLKRRDSLYVAGRPKGLWYKWKRAPLTLDCVLMYAQRGSGKRSSYYSDYTFGAWRETGSSAAELVPVGKAYFGFTDEELLQIDRWVRTHTLESYGPVRAVEPGLVFEVAFDAVARSTRHKSGVAMRFPRIHRIRWDKPAAEADRLETLMAMIEG
jgi:DNA ligase 1